MWNTCSEPLPPRRTPSARLSALLLGALLLPTGCVTHRLPEATRAALSLPSHVKQRYALPTPVQEEYLVPLGNKGKMFRGMLRSGDERCDFHLILPKGDGPAPLVLCLPILAGGGSLMWYISGSLAERGYAVAWTRRVAKALRPGQRGADLERLLRRTVLHNRMVLDWARRQPTIDAGRMALFGISTGGIVGSVILALEPELKAGVICLAGGDLADIIAHSQESRIVRWRRWRHSADGLGPAAIARELEREVLTEPLRFGPYVAAEKVFLVATRLDQVVPMHNQDLLWESLGRPKRLVLPLAHYSAALGLGKVLSSSDRFLRKRLRLPSSLAQASPPSSTDPASDSTPTGPPQSPR